MKTEYELMKVMHVPESVCEGGIDTEPIMVGDGLHIIRRILRDDDSVDGYKLVKKKRKSHR